MIRRRPLISSLAFVALVSCAPATSGDAVTPTAATNRGFILGGTPATGASDRAVFALLHADGQAFCSAVLIGHRTLITAAHCVQQETLSSFTATFADQDSAAVSANTFAPSAIWFHPLFDSAQPTKFAYDLGLIALDRKPSGVEPVRWHSTDINTLVGGAVRHVGYGRDENGMQGVRRTVSTTIDAFFDTRLSSGDSVSGLCFGDSGGGAFHVFSGREELIAVHSHLENVSQCGSSASVRTDEFVDELLDFMNEHEAASCARERKCVNAGCAEVDLDCLCALDGTCNFSCPDADPDCPGVCAADGNCSGVECAAKDPDCRDVGQSCSTIFECQSRLCVSESPTAQYCSIKCGAAAPCADAMTCVEGRCMRSPEAPIGIGMPCSTEQSCVPGALCAALGEQAAKCLKTCTSQLSCPAGSDCVSAEVPERVCHPRAFVLEATEGAVFSPYRAQCSATGSSGLMLLGLTALRRRSKSARV